MTQPEKSTETSPPTKQSKDETSSPAVSVGGVSAETLAQIQAMMDSKVEEGEGNLLAQSGQGR